MNVEYGLYYLLLLMMLALTAYYIDNLRIIFLNYELDDKVEKLFTISQYVVNSQGVPNNLTELPDISAISQKLNISASLSFSPNGDLCIYRIVLYKGKIRRIFICSDS